MQDEMATWRLKMGVAAFIDAIDFVFRIPVLGVGSELIFVGASIALWGKKDGIWMGTELMDMTEQVDGFVPMCCLIGMKCKPLAMPPSPPLTSLPA